MLLKHEKYLCPAQKGHPIFVLPQKKIKYLKQNLLMFLNSHIIEHANCLNFSVLRAKVKKPLLKVKMQKKQEITTVSPCTIARFEFFLASKTKVQMKCEVLFFYLCIGWLGP
jgi:hypothetical protein